MRCLGLSISDASVKIFHSSDAISLSSGEVSPSARDVSSCFFLCEGKNIFLLRISVALMKVILSIHAVMLLFLSYLLADFQTLMTIILDIYSSSCMSNTIRREDLMHHGQSRYTSL